MDPEMTPVIIGGGHRTGTTLLRHILDAHSKIHCGPELRFFRSFYGRHAIDDPLYPVRFFASARVFLPDPEFFRLAGRFLIDLHEKAMRAAGKVRWASKEPDNSIWLNEWDALLDGRFFYVHMLRNAADTVASMKEAVWRESLPAGLRELVAEYNVQQKAGLEWCEANPSRSVAVNYETLVQQPAVVVPALMDLIGEPFEADQLLLRGRCAGPGGDPKFRPTIDAASIGSWRRNLTTEDAGFVVAETSAVQLKHWRVPRL
jgi:hypothetical protein